MMRLKKILMLVVTMILVAAISVTATMAYLKSQTNVTQNAFAVGNVKVSLDEAKVNENGQPVDEDGNVVMKNERTVTRQVISEETSAIMRDALYKVTTGNGGGNGS